jgi:hypothetical protein
MVLLGLRQKFAIRNADDVRDAYEWKSPAPGEPRQWVRKGEETRVFVGEIGETFARATVLRQRFQGDVTDVEETGDIQEPIRGFAKYYASVVWRWGSGAEYKARYEVKVEFWSVSEPTQTEFQNMLNKAILQNARLQGRGRVDLDTILSGWDSAIYSTGNTGEAQQDISEYNFRQALWIYDRKGQRDSLSLRNEQRWPGSSTL